MYWLREDIVWSQIQWLHWEREVQGRGVPGDLRLFHAITTSWLNLWNIFALLYNDTLYMCMCTSSWNTHFVFVVTVFPTFIENELEATHWFVACFLWECCTGIYIYITPCLCTYIFMYWAVQAGLLTPLMFAWQRFSPLAAFTSGAYFLNNGGW